jgi:cytochrome c556
MKKLMIAAAVAAICTAGAAQAADPGAYVEYRMSVMSAVGGHMKAMAGKMKAGLEVTDQTAVHANAIAAMMETYAEAFPADSKGVGKSEATDAVWEKMDAFKAGTMKAAEAAKALAMAAESGAAPAEIGEKLGALGGTCKGCHDTFKK